MVCPGADSTGDSKCVFHGSVGGCGPQCIHILAGFLSLGSINAEAEVLKCLNITVDLSMSPFSGVRF